MSHVDNGALHAYLDGALDELSSVRARSIREHLQGCAHCALRLEAERRVRQDAEKILGLALPDVDAPSFEELRAFARAGREAPPSRSPRAYRLGWAASILVAVGVGWLVRDGQLDTRSAGDERPAPSVSPTDFAERATDVSTGAVSVATPSAAAPPSGGPAVGELPSVPGVAVADARAGDVGTSAAPSEEADLRLAGARGGAAEAPEPATRPAPISAARLAQTYEERRAILVPSVGELTAPAITTVRTEDAADGRAAVSQRAPVMALMEVSPAGRQASRALQEDVELPEEAPLVVPGVELVSIENLVEGTEPLGLHVVQQLRGGSRFDVYHLPEGATPTLLPPLPTGFDEVWGRRGAEWVILRGDLDRATLMALLERLSSPD